MAVICCHTQGPPPSMSSSGAHVDASLKKHRNDGPHVKKKIKMRTESTIGPELVSF